MEKEPMKLVIDGNAVYEIDQACMNRGLNRDLQKESIHTMRRNGNVNPYDSNKNSKK